MCIFPTGGVLPGSDKGVSTDTGKTKEVVNLLSPTGVHFWALSVHIDGLKRGFTKLATTLHMFVTER